MTEKIKQLDCFPELIQGLDHLRAGKYYEPEKIIRALQIHSLEAVVEKLLPEWGAFIGEYQVKLTGTQVITKIARFLKIFEVSVLAAYVTLLGFNLFQQILWMNTVLPWVTGFVFVFFGFTYGIPFFFVEKPVEKFLQNYHKRNRKFAKNLHKLACKLVVELDAHLLKSGMNAGEFGLQLYAKDYPGIFVTTKPGRVIGDRLYRAVPYPLHTVFAENRSRINVLMISYRDDRLLRSLADIAERYQINLVASDNIAGHGIFKRAAEDILEKNSRSAITIISAQGKQRAVVVFTVDGAWQLDFGRSLRPNELKYMPVAAGSKFDELKESFNQGAVQGEKYRFS